jgi:6-phosphogluconolactonase
MADVRMVADTDELARAGAKEVLDRLVAADHGNRPFRIALSGGRTPRGLYEALAEAHGRDARRIPWSRAEFFWGDERHVPPDHPDSNYRMAREALLSRVPVPPEHIHRIPAEVKSAEEAASTYEHTVRAAFGLDAKDGPAAADGGDHAPGPPTAAWPRFDLILLGLGPDGHVASLFPGSDALLEKRRLVAAPWVERLHAHRITLTLPVLNAAACVLFLVSGGDKAETLRGVLEAPTGTASYPAQLVRPAEGSVVWLVDRDAAARLIPGA